MKKRPIIIGVGVAILAIGWYAFRPERLFVNEVVNEKFPATKTVSEGGPQLLTKGEFHGVAHEAKGTASIYKLANGKRVLRFTNFETSNGPDVQVYLGVAPDASDNETVTNAGFRSLGPIKGNKGDQNYDIPEDVDLNDVNSITVWCQRFGANFATAPLSSTSQEPKTLSRGQFHGASHETRGVATIFQLGDGKRVLRFTDFETSNGPDVQVYLGVAPDARDDETVTKAGFFHLAALKGNQGDQNYDIPADVDLSKYKSVTVWCRRFGKNFGTAPLSSGTVAQR